MSNRLDVSKVGSHRPCCPAKEPSVRALNVAISVPDGRSQVLVATRTGVFAVIRYPPSERVIVTTAGAPYVTHQSPTIVASEPLPATDREQRLNSSSAATNTTTSVITARLRPRGLVDERLDVGRGTVAGSDGWRPGGRSTWAVGGIQCARVFGPPPARRDGRVIVIARPPAPGVEGDGAD